MKKNRMYSTVLIAIAIVLVLVALSACDPKPPAGATATTGAPAPTLNSVFLDANATAASGASELHVQLTAIAEEDASK